MNLLLICIVWKMTYKKNQCSKFCQKSIIYSSLLFWGNIENIPNLFTRETNQTDCKAWISNKSTCHTFYQIRGFTDLIIKQYLYILAPNLGWPKIWAKKCTLCFYARIVIPTQAVWVSCKAFLCTSTKFIYGYFSRLVFSPGKVTMNIMMVHPRLQNRKWAQVEKLHLSPKLFVHLQKWNLHIKIQV